MDTLVALGIAVVIAFFFLRGYLKGLKKTEQKARAAAEKGKLYSEGPKAQHPHIDTSFCIGCQSCTMVCPEGDVLAMLGGKAVIVNGYKCIGHSLCEEACPVGAITMVMASPSMSADMPHLTPEYETNVQNLFIIGELGGLALIKNAVNQGRECIDTIAERLSTMGPRPAGEVYDVLIVGAGPAGITASLRCIEKNLKYITVEQDEVGGTVAKYPRQKLVMTSPVEFPMYGKFKKTELSKENLLAFWDKILHRVDFQVRAGEKVDDIKKGEDGIFTIITAKAQYRARAVILALGKTGTPRKLGVKGEDLPKVMYRLIEADHYVNKKILVVGGGDSAVEAAMGLAHQAGNQVTLSYRQDRFSRIKERNSTRVEECIRTGKLKALFNSTPLEFREDVVVMDVKGERQEIPNDFVWIFAGGTPPNDFLKKIGVQLGSRDLTVEASKEAQQVVAAKKQPVKEVPEAAVAMVEVSAEAKLGIPGEELAKVAYRLDDAQRYEDKDILIIGGGDSAIRAALSLGYSGRNRVTLSYRGDHFQRAPAHNRQLIERLEHEKKIRILRNATVAGITPDSSVVSIGGKLAEIPNDLVFILIGPESEQLFQTPVAQPAGGALARPSAFS
ncbi:MAG TPA: NAD(P)-binding domain-containing protein [Terriglobales bacterium]|nr:NAD(P)-binding domain-containing protein [Terriglobales bacterium]